MLSIFSSEPDGISSAAARSSAALREPRRRLPDSPTIFDMMDRIQGVLQDVHRDVADWGAVYALQIRGGGYAASMPRPWSSEPRGAFRTLLPRVQWLPR